MLNIIEYVFWQDLNAWVFFGLSPPQETAARFTNGFKFISITSSNKVKPSKCDISSDLFLSI